MPVPVEHVTKLQMGEYRADLFKAKTAEDGWYAIVQPRHSQEIVAIDRYPTYEAAKEAAMQTLEYLKRSTPAH